MGSVGGIDRRRDSALSAAAAATAAAFARFSASDTDADRFDRACPPPTSCRALPWFPIRPTSPRQSPWSGRHLAPSGAFPGPAPHRHKNCPPGEQLDRFYSRTRGAGGTPVIIPRALRTPGGKFFRVRRPEPRSLAGCFEGTRCVLLYIVTHWPKRSGGRWLIAGAGTGAEQLGGPGPGVAALVRLDDVQQVVVAAAQHR